MFRLFVCGWNKSSPTTIYGSGLQVFTSMDLVLQKERRISFQRNFPKCKKLVGMSLDNKMEGATTVISPTTGELLAVYGGTQLQSTDFSRATQARRQAVLHLKPLVYALGFEQKMKRENISGRVFRLSPMPVEPLKILLDGDLEIMVKNILRYRH